MKNIYPKLITLIFLLVCVTKIQAGINDNSYYDEISAAKTNVAGESKGVFGVSSSGSSIYSINVKLPNGFAGVQPSLSINYNSDIGNGLLGVGWSVGGYSQIHRCNPTIAQDGVNGLDDVDYDGNDPLCLDGARLVSVDATSLPGGVAGACNDEDTVEAVYLTEVDSYSRITACIAANTTPYKYFKVWSKSGKVIEYGSTLDSRIEIAINASNEIKTHTWSISKVNEIRGQSSLTKRSVKYYYQTTYSHSADYDQVTVEHYPTAITYTSTTNINASRTVRFIYSDRQDNYSYFSHGLKFSQTKRIAAINVFMGTIGVEANLKELVPRESEKGEPVLIFKYMESGTNKQSLLSEFSECALSECLHPMEIDWYNSARKYNKKESIITNSIYADPVILDMDGDDIQDIFYLYDQAGYGYPNWKLFKGTLINSGKDKTEDVSYQELDIDFRQMGYSQWGLTTFFPIDYDNDGKSELLVNLKHSSSEQATWIVFMYDGSSFTSINTGKLVHASSYTADINGDTYKDIVFRKSDNNFWVYPGSATGFLDEEPLMEVTTSGTQQIVDLKGFLNLSVQQSVGFQDYNGDGREDFSTFDQDNCTRYVSLSSQSSFSFKKIESHNCKNFSIIDVNGDSNIDFLVWKEPATSNNFDLLLSNGVEVAELTNAIDTGVPRLLVGMYFSVDYNADGYQDILSHCAASPSSINSLLISVGLDCNKWNLWVSNGDGTFELQVLDIAIDLKDHADVPSKKNVRIFDANSDSYPDLLVNTESDDGWVIYYNRKTSSFYEASNKVKSFNSKYFQPTLIAYKSASSSSVYEQTSTSTSSFPIVSARLSKAVVEGYSSYPTGKIFQYRNSKINLQGRGWLGFEEIISTDAFTNISEHSYYIQPFPKTGMLARKQVYLLEEGSDHSNVCGDNKVCLTDSISSPSSRIQSYTSEIPIYQLYSTGSSQQFYHFQENGETTEKQSTLQKVIVSSETIDQFGNQESLSVSTYPLSVSTNYLDYFTTTTEMDYAWNSIGNGSVDSAFVNNDRWFVSDIKSNSFYTSGPSYNTNSNTFNIESSETLSTTYDYHSGGFLSCQATQKNDGIYTVEKCYEYDSLGNISLIKTGGFDGQFNDNGIAINSNIKSYSCKNIRYIGTSLYSITEQSIETTAGACDANGSFIGNILTSSQKNNVYGGYVSQNTTPNGISSSLSKDGFGRTLSVTTPVDDELDKIIKTTYSDYLGDCGDCTNSLPFAIEEQMVSGTNSIPKTKKYFNSYGQEVLNKSKAFDGSDICVKSQYYFLGIHTGKIEKQTLPYKCIDGEVNALATNYFYDSINRLTTRVAPSNATTVYTYDGLTSDGYKTTTATQRENEDNSTFQVEKRIEYSNSLDWLIKSIDAAGTIHTVTSEYFRDQKGRLKQVKIANDGAHAISYNYDKLGRVVEMSDPSMGLTKYAYNAFGKLVWQKDNQDIPIITKIAFDGFGRKIQRSYQAAGSSNPSLTEFWAYDSSAQNAQGMISSTSNSEGFSETYRYDNHHGKLEKISSIIDGVTYERDYIYDSFGRLQNLILPGGHSDTRLYSKVEYSGSYRSKICIVPNIQGSCESDDILWEAKDYELDGNIKEENRGSINTKYTYHNGQRRLTGILSSRIAGASFELGKIQNLSYRYDNIGNLDQVTDLNRLGENNTFGVTENYLHDYMNRIIVAPLQTFKHNSFGSIEYMTRSLGSPINNYYSYGENNQPKNAVTSIGPDSIRTYPASPTLGDANGDGNVNGADIAYTSNQIIGLKNANGNPDCSSSAGIDIKDVQCLMKLSNYSGDEHGKMFVYDKNGNMTSGGGRLIKYTEFNKPYSIEKEGAVVTFDYNSNHMRYKKTTEQYGETKITRYLDKQYEEITLDNGDIINRYFIVVAGKTIAIISKGVDNPIYDKTEILHNDRLGNVVVITNPNGHLVERFAYEPYGKRIVARWIDAKVSNLSTNFNSRTFTQHEYLPEVGLIHMNGRVYDPEIGRFLSPDPVVQSPNLSQSWNRYSYVMNSPLRYSDPSGHLFLVDDFVIGFVKGFVRNTDYPFTGAWNGALKDTKNSFKIWGGLFRGDAGQIASRFTLELPQTVLGFGAAHATNTLFNVNKVEYWGGATVIQRNDSNGGAFVLGSYINGGKTIEADPNNSLFQHEYGHYLQSQAAGWGYLSRYAIPSFIDDIKNNRNDHMLSSIEQDANARAFTYFNENVAGFYDTNPLDANGWDFGYNPIDINNQGLSSFGVYVDFHNPNDMQAVFGLQVEAHFFDIIAPPLIFTPLGVSPVIGMGIYNAFDN